MVRARKTTHGSASCSRVFPEELDWKIVVTSGGLIPPRVASCDGCCEIFSFLRHFSLYSNQDIFKSQEGQMKSLVLHSRHPTCQQLKVHSRGLLITVGVFSPYIDIYFFIFID